MYSSSSIDRKLYNWLILIIYFFMISKRLGLHCVWYWGFILISFMSFDKLGLSSSLSFRFILCSLFLLLLFFFTLSNFLYKSKCKSVEQIYLSCIDEPDSELLARESSLFTNSDSVVLVRVGVIKVIFKPLHQYFSDFLGVITPRPVLHSLSLFYKMKV